MPNNGGAPVQGQGNQNDGYLPSKGHIMSIIHPIPKSKKEHKSISRQVNLAITSPPPTTEYLGLIIQSSSAEKITSRKYLDQDMRPWFLRHKSEYMMLTEYSWTQGVVST
jgi:hypothetical protein